MSTKEGKHKKGLDTYWVVFRVVVGLLFLSHGASKLFGVFGVDKVALGSLIGASGVIEFVVGILLVLGLFTRLAALVGAGEMLVAYLMVHVSGPLVPFQNGGEPAVLFFLALLLIYFVGPMKCSVDTSMRKKK